MNVRNDERPSNRGRVRCRVKNTSCETSSSWPASTPCRASTRHTNAAWSRMTCSKSGGGAGGMELSFGMGVARAAVSRSKAQLGHGRKPPAGYGDAVDGSRLAADRVAELHAGPAAGHDPAQSEPCAGAHLEARAQLEVRPENPALLCTSVEAHGR